MEVNDGPITRVLNAVEIAAEFGMKRRAALNWATAGCPHDDLGRGAGRGKRFNLLEVRRWIADTGRRLAHGGGLTTITQADMMGPLPPKGKKAQNTRKSSAKGPQVASSPVDVSIGGNMGSATATLPADAGAHEAGEFDFLAHKQQLSLAKLRKELAMAQKYEIECEQKRGNLIPVEEVERSRLDRVAYARAHTIGMPSILAPDLAHAPLEVIEAALTEWVAQILSDLAGTQEEATK